MTAQRKKPPKKKRAARKKRWGPAKPPRQKVDGERLNPISLHPLDFEDALKRLLGVRDKCDR